MPSLLWNVLVGLWALGVFTSDTVTGLPSVAQPFQPATEAAAEDFDLLDVLSRAARAAWILDLSIVVGGFLLRLGRSH